MPHPEPNQQSALPPLTVSARDGHKRIGVSLRGWYHLAQTDPDFPKPVMLGGPRSTRWFVSELDAYALSRPRRSIGDEPAALAAARAAKAAGRAPAPAPFNGVAA